jgi:hypothetical protein
MSGTSIWPAIAFDLAPRDDSGLPISGSGSSAPIELMQVFAGATGPPGPSYTPSEFSLVTSTNGLQVLTLPTPALSGGTLFINGLAQRKESYALSGTALSLPADLCLLEGDLITFVYPT